MVQGAGMPSPTKRSARASGVLAFIVQPGRDRLMTRLTLSVDVLDDAVSPNGRPGRAGLGAGGD